MIAALTALTLAAQPVLPPTSTWLLASNGQCTLSRDYDTAAMPLTVGFRPYPFSQNEDVVLVLPAATALRAASRVTLAFGAGEPIQAYWQSFATSDGRSRVLSLTLDRDRLAALATAPSLTLTIGETVPITLALTGMKAALARLAACDAGAIRALGIDPDEAAGIATPAVATNHPEAWVMPDDYPSEALRDESQGMSFVIWTIGPNGRVIDCQVGVSSGDPVLDAAACKVIMRRGRYSPAIGINGQPTISHAGRRVNWRLP